MKYSTYKYLLSKAAILTSSILILGASSCTKELVKINKNPNATENPTPDFLLGGAEKSAADVYWGQSSNFGSSELLTQHWAMIQYTDPDRYIFTGNSFAELWTTLYATSLTDVNEMMKRATELSNNNFLGIGHVLRAWNFQLLTDAYGYVPYQAAGNAEQTPLAAYDSQETVYTGILKELDTALEQLDPASAAVEGDLIYGGDINLWRKFARSLQLRIAMRIVDAAPDLAKTYIQKVASSELISSNKENAQFIYDESPNWNPVANNFSTRNDFRISKTIVDRLKALNDPRLPIYASRPQDQSVAGYVGVPNGLTTDAANNLGLDRTSKPGAYFLEAHAPALIQSYSEVLFLQAEAAARGLMAGDAEALYKQAITASLEQYGVSESAINSYLSTAAVKYNANNFKKSIGDQKWIALFGQGLEAFAEWRRLDYPELKAGVSAIYAEKIPIRFTYPSREQTLNGKAYKEAVAAQGKDDLFTRLWFDKY